MQQNIRLVIELLFCQISRKKMLSSYSKKMNNQLKMPLSLKKFIYICMWDTHNILRWLPFLRYEATHYSYINWCVNCGWPIHQHRKSICMTLLMGLLINLPRSFAISGPVHYCHLMSPQMFSSETMWLCLSYRCNKILLQNTILFQWEGSGLLNFQSVINHYFFINQNHSLGCQQHIKFF